MKRRLLIISFFSICLQMNAIDKSELMAAFDEIYIQNSDQEKISKSDEFKGLLINYLDKNNPFEADLTGFKMFSELEEKKTFRIFNWNIPLDNDNHFECIFAVPSKENSFKLIECKATKRPLAKILNRTMSNKDWPAALYYDIIPLDKKSQSFALLGWDGHDEMSNRKIIEIISVSEKVIRFGSNKFKECPKPIKRHVMEYGNEATASINYEPKFKRIVFDHLSPTRPDLEGQYAFYVPDMTFDAFVIKKGFLYFRENIKYLREKKESDKDFYDPRK